MKTWSLDSSPPNTQAITCKWIYKKKPRINVEAKKYKTRLIARGCEQKIKVNFGKTFAPITKWNTIEAMNALARSKGWKTHHLHLKTTFLNKHLHDEVYMQQPRRYEVPRSEHLVYRLFQALYGLNQAPLQWF